MMMMMAVVSTTFVFFLVTSNVVVNGFTTTTTTTTTPITTSLAANLQGESTAVSISRRQWLVSSAAAAIVGAAVAATQPAFAEENEEKTNKKVGVSLEDSLYLILRVREATQQETRLITTGKFKDIQRANVKLAVSMMVTNYRLSDNINTAAAYLSTTGNSMKAINTGQAAVQNLQTILEYFDTSDVQNLKVNEASMSGEKQALVLKGLESAKNNLDSFVSFFPQELVENVKQRIQNENELNRKEFDPTLGDILNLPK